MSDEITRYKGDKINVEWNGKLCIHIAECSKSEGELFVDKRDPWCQPDLVSVDNVVDIIKRCPTGALSFESNNSSVVETAEDENTITVSTNGPYFIRGELEIEGAPEDSPGLAHRAALCRCGASKNKPFCDNSHNEIGFKDSGAIGDKGELDKGLVLSGGKLTVTPVEDGPLILNGNMVMRSGSGRLAWAGTKVALCRCGASKTKPICDGSHTTVNFKSAN